MTNASAGMTQTAWDFEPSNSSNNGAYGWFFGGSAGLDTNPYSTSPLAYYSHKGTGNAWIRNTTGWNSSNVWVSVASAPTNAQCYASAWLRTSSNLTDGYMTVRSGDKADGSGKILSEIKLVGSRPYSGNPNDKGYYLHSFSFNKGSNSRVLFYVGLWGNGQDSWIQLDDAAISCKTPY
jgi:hypothetical protein